MRYIILSLLLSWFSNSILAEELPHTGLVLSEATINQADLDSIKRGAKFFSANCMSCHTMKYLRYDKIAKEAGITLDKMPLNVKVWPNGVQPPDLSSEADIRGIDWLYTYLHSFYQDSARPTGANNLLVPGSAMPNILAPYQGDQVLNPKPTADLYGQVRWYDLLILTRQGTVTADQFDATVGDVVNFLAYASAPYHNDQQRIGYWVLGFLVILFGFLYLLKVEYWKDIKKTKKH